MSIVVVAFEGAPKPTPEAIKQDMDLDEKIETKIKGVYSRTHSRSHQTRHGHRKKDLLTVYVLMLNLYPLNINFLRALEFAKGWL